MTLTVLYSFFFDDALYIEKYILLTKKHVEITI